MEDYGLRALHADRDAVTVGKPRVVLRASRFQVKSASKPTSLCVFTVQHRDAVIVPESEKL